MNNTPDSPAKPPDDRMDQGGNYWTLFNPGIWKVLHAVLHDIDGKVAGVGSAWIDASAIAADARFIGPAPVEPTSAARKLAVLGALGITSPTADQVASLRIKDVEGGISVKATGAIQRAMWGRRIVAFRTTIAAAGPDAYHCTAIALADD